MGQVWIEFECGATAHGIYRKVTRRIDRGRIELLLDFARGEQMNLRGILKARRNLSPLLVLVALISPYSGFAQDPCEEISSSQEKLIQANVKRINDLQLSSKTRVKGLIEARMGVIGGRPGMCDSKWLEKVLNISYTEGGVVPFCGVVLAFNNEGLVHFARAAHLINGFSGSWVWDGERNHYTHLNICAKLE